MLIWNYVIMFHHYLTNSQKALFLISYRFENTECLNLFRFRVSPCNYICYYIDCEIAMRTPSTYPHLAAQKIVRSSQKRKGDGKLSDATLWTTPDGRKINIKLTPTTILLRIFNFISRAAIGFSFFSFIIFFFFGFSYKDLFLSRQQMRR